VALKVLNSWSVFDTPVLAASVTHALLIILRNGDVMLFFPNFSLLLFDSGWSFSSFCLLQYCILGSNFGCTGR
jgi:hypothetical protein